MRRQPSILLTGTAMVAAGLLLGASSAASHAPGDRVTLLASGPGATLDAPAAPPEPLVNLDTLAGEAISIAEERGADITFELLDRQTGRMVHGGDGAAFPLASVAKLFIADDLLMQTVQRKARLSADDRSGLDAMLRSSDDYAANVFWARGGGNAIISRVAARYGLTATTPPYDGNWWTTMSTVADLVRYYDKLLDGSGGLPRQQTQMILDDLGASTPLGADGYPQTFGIPDGLFAEHVAVKQGWMCCWNGPNWLHMSTGVAGPGNRYVIAIGSMQPVDEATARNTITQVVKGMFPGGHV